MFGAFGIVIGPVLMIVIVTTISVYLAVYKGVPLEQHDDDEHRASKKKRALGMVDAQGQAVRAGSARAGRRGDPRRESAAKPAAP